MQNDGKEMYKISELHVQSCFFFSLIRPIIVFHRSSALPSPLSITRFYTLFELIINIIEASLLAVAKSIQLFTEGEVALAGKFLQKEL